MKVKTISYQKTFNLGNYCSERIGLDLELEEGKTIEQTLDEAKKTATDWHIANNPQMYAKKTNLVDTYRGCSDTDINTIKDKINKSVAVSSPSMFHLSPPCDALTITKVEAPIEKRSNSIIESINTCTSLKTLESYKFIVKGKPDLQKAYDTKMKELKA